MDKLVTYSVVARKNPSDSEGAPKFYAKAQARGVMGIREMAERIQRGCTVTRADTMAVLIALEDAVAEGLQQGQIVRLGDLGSLQLSLSGKGAETEDGFHEGLITKARILFRPGETLQEALANLGYERVPTKSKAKEEAGEDEETSLEAAGA